MNTNKVKVKREETSVTVDVLIFTIENDTLKVLLVKRANEPYLGEWAIPGGFIKPGESLDEAAIRIAHDRTGVAQVYLEQLYTFGDPKRDPRSRVVTVAYYALIPWENLKRPESEKVSEARWQAVDDIPNLAFDHNKILSYAVERLRIKADYSNIVYGLLPEKFRLSDLQKIYEIILGKNLDKRNFRKKM